MSAINGKGSPGACAHYPQSISSLDRMNETVDHLKTRINTLLGNGEKESLLNVTWQKASQMSLEFGETPYGIPAIPYQLLPLEQFSKLITPALKFGRYAENCNRLDGKEGELAWKKLHEAIGALIQLKLLSEPYIIPLTAELCIPTDEIETIQGQVNRLYASYLARSEYNELLEEFHDCVGKEYDGSNSSVDPLSLLGRALANLNDPTQEVRPL